MYIYIMCVCIYIYILYVYIHKYMYTFTSIHMYNTDNDGRTLDKTKTPLSARPKPFPSPTSSPVRKCSHTLRFARPHPAKPDPNAMRHSTPLFPTTKRRNGRRRGTAATDCMCGARHRNYPGRKKQAMMGRALGGGGLWWRWWHRGGCRPSVSNKTLCAVYASGQKITKLLAEHHWFLGGFGCFSFSFACLRNNGLLHVFGESFVCRGQSGGEICCRVCRGRGVELHSLFPSFTRWR